MSAKISARPSPSGALLPAAAAWLIGQHSDGKRCDLRQVRCVLPGTRAGRLLLHSLLAQCAEAGLRLVPPQVLTPGTMVDQLVPATSGTASDLECTLGWMHALREADPAQIAALLPSRPDSQDWPAWHELAAQIGDRQVRRMGTIGGSILGGARVGGRCLVCSDDPGGERDRRDARRVIAQRHCEHSEQDAGEQVLERHGEPPWPAATFGCP